MILRYKYLLLQLFSRIHELKSSPLKNRLMALEIQEELIGRISSTERIIRKTKTKQKSIKEKFSKPGNDKRTSILLKKDYDRYEVNIRRQQFLAWIYRTIGDSIAFIYGDRWDLKQLFLKDDAGFITGKRGSRLERKILRTAYQMGAMVIMNDLTNTLRHGDITLFRPDLWPNGNSPFLLFEAKSGKGGNKKRLDRQKQAIKHISDYIATDKREVENGNWVRIGFKNEPQHHFEDVSKLTKIMFEDGWAFDEVEPGLYYLLIDIASNFSVENTFPDLFKDKQNLLMLSVNDFKGQVLGYYPFPLCFNDPELLFKFYNGEFLINIFVDIDKVNQVLLDRQLFLKVSNKPDYPLQIISKELSLEEQGESYVSYHILGRLAAEFLRLDWLVENIIAGPLHEEFLKMQMHALKDSKLKR